MSNVQTELFMKLVCSFIRKGWNFTRRINHLINLREKRAVMHRIGQERKSSSRRSYEESDRRIEQNVLYRS